MSRELLIEIQHANLVGRLAKDPRNISLDVAGKDLMHAAFGIFGEAGELCDAIKKAIIYNKPLDMDNMIEELGDLEFYLQQLRTRLSISRRQCLKANIAKLNKRYPQGNYSDADAQARADKAKAHPISPCISKDGKPVEVGTKLYDQHVGEPLTVATLDQEGWATWEECDGTYPVSEYFVEPPYEVLHTETVDGRKEDIVISTLPPKEGPTKSVLLRIAQERQKQREKWGDEHDDTEHRHDGLAMAAAFWAVPKTVRDLEAHESLSIGDILWPFLDVSVEDATNKAKAKGETREDELVRAAAFIISEIERLRRKEAASG